MDRYNKAEIVKAIHDGFSVSDICKKYCLPKSTVFLMKKKLKGTGNIDRKIGSGRSVSKVTPAFTTELMTKFNSTPNKSFRKISKELHVDEKTIRNVAHKCGFKRQSFFSSKKLLTYV